MRLRFTIRNLLWLTVVVALVTGWWIEHNRRLKDPNVPDRYEVWDNNDRRDLIIDLQMKKAWIRDGDQWERVPDSDLR